MTTQGSMCEPTSSVSAAYASALGHGRPAQQLQVRLWCADLFVRDLPVAPSSAHLVDLWRTPACTVSNPKSDSQHQTSLTRAANPNSPTHSIHLQQSRYSKAKKQLTMSTVLKHTARLSSLYMLLLGCILTGGVSAQWARGGGSRSSAPADGSDTKMTIDETLMIAYGCLMVLCVGQLILCRWKAWCG